MSIALQMVRTTRKCHVKSNIPSDVVSNRDYFNKIAGKSGHEMISGGYKRRIRIEARPRQCTGIVQRSGTGSIPANRD
jgi:hypothetical protein